MSKTDYPAAVTRLILALKQLPGVGPRSAERVALWMLQGGREAASELARAVEAARDSVTPCPRCGFFATQEGCGLCTDATRATSQLCVVEAAADVLPIERTGAFRGGYHVLGGRLSPLDNVGPEALRLPGLRQRVREEAVEEVILALGSDVEGEATSHFIEDSLAGTGVAVTRLAQGLPAGGDLGHADQLTLLRAFHGRR